MDWLSLISDSDSDSDVQLKDVCRLEMVGDGRSSSGAGWNTRLGSNVGRMEGILDVVQRVQTTSGQTLETSLGHLPITDFR